VYENINLICSYRKKKALPNRLPASRLIALANSHLTPAGKQKYCANSNKRNKEGIKKNYSPMPMTRRKLNLK